MEIVSKGTGMIAGLDIWRSNGKFLLVDSSSDSRFASDVGVWNCLQKGAKTSAVGLNTRPIKKRKDAKKQDTTSSCSTNTDS